MASRRVLRLPVHRRPRPGQQPEPSAGRSVDQRWREVQIGNVRWVDVLRPLENDIERLRDEFGFHELALEDTLSRVQRPKLDEYDDYLFLVLHFPVHYKASRTTLPAEVDIFVGRDYVVTLHDGTLKPLLRLFDRLSNRQESSDPPVDRASGHLLYDIVDALVDYCFPIVYKVGQNIDRVEQMIFTEPTFRTVQEISILRRDIIALRRIIRPQIAILALLERRHPDYLGDELDAYFGAILDHVSKLWDILDDYREVVEGLSYTNDSLTSHRINEVIKVLTLLTVFMLPLTLVTSFYGMNVPLPYAESSISTWLILGTMVAVEVAMVAYFKVRGWF